MTDLWHKLLAALDHNRYLFLAILGIVLCAALLFGAQGCQSTTLPLVGTEPVTRQELAQQAVQVQTDLDKQQLQLNAQIAAYNLEVAALNKRIEAGLEDLDKKDQLRADLLNTVALVAEQAGAGTLNPYALVPLGIGLLGGLLGLGTAADNRRKDSLIAGQKTALAAARITSAAATPL